MANETTISKWGNSVAVRIPLAIANLAGIGEGDCVRLALTGDGGMDLRPPSRRYDVPKLVVHITPKNRHRETEWGQPQGDESW
jgi:antitoxin MazE